MPKNKIGQKNESDLLAKFGKETRVKRHIWEYSILCIFVTGSPVHILHFFDAGFFLVQMQ